MNTFQFEPIVVLDPALDGSVAFLLQVLLAAAEAVLRQRAAQGTPLLQSPHHQTQAA